MKKYTYLVNFDSQTLERVGESFAVKGDGGIAELEFAIPSNFGIPANQALWRVFFKLPGERESLFETLPTVEQTESGDYVTAWVISKAITQKAGRLAFSLAAISGNDIQWNSRTVIMQVPESQYQPESEEAEEPYTGRLDALEGSMAAIRGEFAEVQEAADEATETASAASAKVDSAITKADAVNERLDNIIIESGTSEAEVVAARTNSDTGTTYNTLGARLDTEYSETKEDLSALVSTAIYQYAGEGKTGFFITGGATHAWGSSKKTSNLVFRIPKGTKSIKVDAKTDQTAIIAFLRSYAPIMGEIPDWSVEHPTRITIDAGGSAEYEVHADMVYMYMIVKDTSLVYHTPTLTFTYPSDLPLAPLDDTSDRSTEINLLLELFGKCILTKGTYYVSGIVMPDSTALIGTPNSIVRLIDDVTSGSAITMSKNSLVQGVFLEGGLSTVGTTEGTRYGIEWTGEETVTGFVDDCIIRGFDGAGILLHDTTQNVYRNLLVTNCRIRTNFIGIDIKKNSEFNRITNCSITANYYGIRNRGGNNHVDNCGLDANTIGIQVDADEGTNGGHGGISNCTINHSDHNNGYGIIIKDTGRMLVTGCNVYYSKIMLNNTDGNVFSACGFGHSAGWEITDGACNMFTGCMIRSTSDSPITITNNTQTKVVNCYTRDGVAVTI